VDSPAASAQVLRSAQDDEEVELADLVTRFGVCCICAAWTSPEPVYYPL